MSHRADDRPCAPLGGGSVPARPFKLIARLFQHSVMGAVLQTMPFTASAMFGDTPAVPFSKRGDIPWSQPLLAAISVMFQPTSFVLSHISSPFR